MVSPLKKYPKLKQFQVYQKGDIASYSYEIRCNGRSDGRIVPFCFVLFHQKERLMVIQDEGAEEILGQVFLRSYTSLGTNVDLCGASLDEKIAFSVILARQYIDDPQSFIVQRAEEDSDLLPPLKYFPQLQSSQLVETASIGAYRYELHTQCASLQKIQYHHVLFCYAPFQENPCFVVSAESFGDFRPTLGLFHNNGHSNLGPKSNLLDIVSFRKAAFDLVRRELLQTEIESDEALPPFQQGELVEKGLIGSYRCAMFVNIPAIGERVFFHGFALFSGGMRKPDFLFVLEKSPEDPTPNLILYRHGVCTNLGFEQSMLDVKFFRDRVVALLRLILREEELQKEELSPATAKKLLNIHRFYLSMWVSIFVNVAVLLWGNHLVGRAVIDQVTLSFVSSGTHCITMMCSAIMLRFVGLSNRLIFGSLLLLGLPLLDVYFFAISIVVIQLFHHVVSQTFQRHHLHYNWFGLSRKTTERLKNIVYSTSPIHPSASSLK